MNSSKTSQQPMSLLEAAALRLEEKWRASGRTVIVDSEPSDGQECEVMFPPNRASAPNLSESRSNTSNPQNSAQPDPMQPAADAIEAYLKQGAMPLPNTDKEPKSP